MKRIDVAYSLITDKDKTKILMVKNHKNGTWSLPGGGVEENETLDQKNEIEIKYFNEGKV